MKKSINILLITLFFTHAAFMHHILDSFVHCSTENGQLTLEYIHENSSNVICLGNTDSTCSHNNFGCEDVSLDQNCFEYGQVISKDKTFFVYVIQLYVLHIHSAKPKSFYCLPVNYQLKNPILENYSTISLLI